MVIMVVGVFIFLAMTAGVHAFPDEGMWTFDNPPIKQLQEQYGFTPTQEWLDLVRLASVRFMDGGSGSFISPNGLVLTNHHVAMGQLQKLSTAEHNYVATGFLANSLAEEIKCPDLEVNILVAVENVTDQVRKAIKKDMNEAEALKARRAVIAEIEKKSLKKTGLRSDVVSLYHGGEYWLYQYKKYTDVRLVMAPERQAAYFGGDYDNFTYPRYDLDMAFFRVYENDKPIQSKHYFKWNENGAAENELVFVSGHPGSTDRLYTYAQLVDQRDFQYAFILKYIDKYLEALREYASQGEEQSRRALGRIFGLENGKKAMTGEYQGLLDEELMAKRLKDEQEFRKLVADNPELQQQFGDAWDTIEKIMKENFNLAEKRFYRSLRGSTMAGNALTIVRFVEEIKKNDADRLPGYHDSQTDELKFRLLSPAPIYKDMEITIFTKMLESAVAALGANDQFLTLVLDGKNPADVVKNLIENSQMDKAEFRTKLIEGGADAVKNCQDPLIKLALKIDPMLRESDTWFRENVESKLTPASEKVAKARFAVYGKTTYPDATFTLRLSYGTVQGYPYNGTIAPYQTTLYGAYDRAASFGNKGDFELPKRFWDRKDQLDLATPVNFVSTCDIIGGNSGSPVINKNAELVGLIFDGNIESLPGRFVYDGTKNRAVSVHSGYILKALRSLYDAKNLVDEIESAR